MTQRITTNGWQAWVLAARPKTLIAALVPVAAATALALREGQMEWRAAGLCALFAALLQIASNFINDWYDFLKGTDGAERLGPLRACTQGWITPRAMRWGIAGVLLMASTTGLFLLRWGGWELVGIGVLCIAAAFLYTIGGSYIGLGDLMVWLFFGIVPVLGTYYVQTHALHAGVFWIGMGCGLTIDTLLVVNNYRDRDTDRKTGKHTLIARWGERFGRMMYVAVGVMGWLCLLPLMFSERGRLMVLLCTLPFLWLHFTTYRKMAIIRSGAALNSILGATARNIFLYGAGIVVGLLCSAG